MPDEDQELEAHEHTSRADVRPVESLACERAAGIFRALGDTNRLRLLSLLMSRELCVSEITGILDDNLSAVSQRLKTLRAERIVAARREGKHVFYSLADGHVRDLIANALAHGNEHE
ncbi:MAG: helix-turn-helix transcriptional regulator [Planctomycetes bacterium]|nr:helix-turn-helix transcriptional regulator [Planctomycetota bacterium]